MQDDWYIVRYPSAAATEGEVLTDHHFPTEAACKSKCQQLSRSDRRGIYEATQLGGDNTVHYTLVIPLVQPSTATLQ